MTRDERLHRLETRVSQAAKMLSRVAEQLAEQNLRVRFVMDWFLFGRADHGGLIIDGKPQVTKLNLFEIYATGGREQMLQKLEAEMQMIAKQMAQEKTADLNDADAFEGEADDDDTPETGAAESADEADRTGDAGAGPSAEDAPSSGDPAGPARRLRFQDIADKVPRSRVQ